MSEKDFSVAPSPSGLAIGGMIERGGVPYIDYLPDNADEVLNSYPLMAARCVDCAYTSGTGANADPMTSRISQECAEARCAFWCHKTINEDGIPTHLCSGWRDTIIADRTPERPDDRQASTEGRRDTTKSAKLTQHMEGGDDR